MGATATPLDEYTLVIRGPEALAHAANGVRQTLQHLGVYDRRLRLTVCRDEEADGSVTIQAPVVGTDSGARAAIETHLKSLLDPVSAGIEWTCGQKLPVSKARAAREKSLRQRLLAAVARMLSECLVSEAAQQALVEALPQKWEQYDDFILFAQGAFDEPVWRTFLQSVDSGDFFDRLAIALRHRHLAVKQRIPTGNVQRRPCVRTLTTGFGSVEEDDGSKAWTATAQVGITYVWCPLHTMFSAGNISEKHRMRAIFRCAPAGETIVDLYAGIGYWVVLALKYARPSRVFACELNPWSIEGLSRTVDASKVSREALVVLPGDNAASLPAFKGQADRVLLGLLPSARAGWPLAVQALKPRGGVLYVHENLRPRDIDSFQAELVRELPRLWVSHCPGLDPLVVSASVVHVELVKHYAPGVNHYVFDVLLSGGSSA